MSCYCDKKKPPGRDCKNIPLRPIYMGSVFQCRMRQPRPTPHKKIGLFLSLDAAVASDTENHCPYK
jgi:hypothetical protein